MTQIAHILGYQLARHLTDFEFCKSLGILCNFSRLLVASSIQLSTDNHI